MAAYSSYIYIDGNWKKVRPVIINITNMGKIPSNALITSEGIPFLTNSKEFFLVNPSTPGLTAESSSDYLFREDKTYTPYIL